MPRISPFTSLVFDPAIAGALDGVTAPPYDVIGEEDRRAFLSSSPYSVVHLDLSEGSGDEDRYERAARLLDAWLAAGVVAASPQPTYYAYEMRFRLDGHDRRIRGLLCALELEDWGGDVLPHERTMPGPVEDRLQLLRATRTNLSAVYGTVAGPVPELSVALDRVTADEPFASVEDEEGVRHRCWAFAPDRAVAGWLAAEPLLIADGHHRYTTALRYRAERRAHDGPGSWDAVLAFVVDAGTEAPPVLPFHRIASGGEPVLEGVRVRDLREVLAELDDDAMTVGVVARDAGGLLHSVATLSGAPPTVAALHERVLDTATDGVDLRFTPDAAAAEAAVRTGAATAAYLLPATTAERILAVVERGERLPQKSTFFWPKPRTGMVLRALP
jgi:uncharacterized protein (DUF1015 family)